jgi:gag-polypeptide of LTR copia-type
MSLGSDNTKLTTVVLSGNKNYIPWSRQITIGLCGKGKSGFINGTKQKPIPKDPLKITDEETNKIEEWQTSDHMVMSWLLSTMEPQIANMFMYFNSSKEVWDKAERLYGQQKNFSHIFNLKQELTQTKQSNQTNSQLVTEIVSKWEELNFYLPPTTDPIEIQKRNKMDLIFTYLGALDGSYDAIRAQILNSNEMPSFDDVVARVGQEESQRQLMNSQAPESQDIRIFKAQIANPRGAAKTRGTPANVDWCDHCRRAGHNRDGCWVLHPHLRPARPKGERGNYHGGARKREDRKGFGGKAEVREVELDSADTENKPSNQRCDSEESSMANGAQLTKLLSQLNAMLQQQNCTENSKGFSKTFSTFYSSKGLTSSVCSKNNYQNNLDHILCKKPVQKIINLCQNSKGWIIYSGATDHMTYDQTKLQNFEKSKNSQYVTVANNDKVRVHGIGSTKLFIKIINNILYLPEY